MFKKIVLITFLILVGCDNRPGPGITHTSRCEYAFGSAYARKACTFAKCGHQLVLWDDLHAELGSDEVCSKEDWKVETWKK